MSKEDAIKFSLKIIGAAYRGDWSNADGRVIRIQMDFISNIFDLDDSIVITEREIMRYLRIKEIESGHYEWDIS